MAKTSHPKLAVAGIAGSFCAAAAEQFCHDYNLRCRSVYTESPTEAFECVNRGLADYGIVPLENARGGIVTDTIYAMSRYLFTTVCLVDLPVVHHLMVCPGTPKQSITAIASHPQAFSQAADYLAKTWPQAEQRKYVNTAIAAQDLQQGKLDKSVAVIASATAAELYDLEIMDRNIQDDELNLTNFLVFEVGKQIESA